GNNKAKTLPLVFLVNENSPEAEILGGLQAAQVAFVIQDGAPTAETGVATTTIKLPDNVEVIMRKAELANPDGTIGFAADAIAPQGEAWQLALRLIAENKFVSNRPKPTPTFAAQVSQKEKPYAEMEFPPTEYRLLALFRFWTIIHYFFPYKDLQDAPWESVLPKFIPRFEANKDAGDYQLTVREMAAEVQDSHVRVGNAQKALDRLGRFSPPFYAKFIEGQSVVVRVLDESGSVRPGDTILTVDGEAAETYREKLSRYFSASTPQAMQRLLHLNLLRGPKDSKCKLSVRGLDGKVREVEVVRSVAGDDPRLPSLFSNQRTTPVVAVLPSGFGYVDLARLTIAEVDKMFATIKPTSATIFDMRGYPNGTAWEIAPRLTAKKSPAAALFSRPLLDASLLGIPDYGKPSFTFEQPLPEAKGEMYQGRVVMLINEDAISQAEGTCMFFQTATDVTFIGTPTMGANGDVTDTTLPGNLTVRFTGHNVRHADGRQLQRVGIQPHIRVAPTIRGTIEGRDEVLEAAIKFLQASKQK
ncbi:MAG: hypothetical protein JNM09_30990, partial [Blastocatellia bacterium]|nr:hypothetical protein [Blastocatellia bacterium]